MKSVSLAGEVTERIFSIHLDGETISIRTNTYHTILTELKFLHTDYKEKILGSYVAVMLWICLLYTSPSPRDLSTSRMPSSA